MTSCLYGQCGQNSRIVSSGMKQEKRPPFPQHTETNREPQRFRYTELQMCLYESYYIRDW